MNPLYGDEFTRRVLKPIVPESSSPNKFITPNGSPQVTPTKYRPDGGDRYIPVREDDKEWTKKYSKIDLDVFSPNKQKPTAKRNLTALQHPREMQVSSSHVHSNNNMSVSATLNMGHHSSSSSSNYQCPSNNDDSYHDSATHHALLSNELLNDSIVDIQNGTSPTDAPNVLYRQPPDSLFRFSNKTPVKHGQPTSSIVSPLFSSSPLSADSQRLLKSPRKPQRKVSKNPYKVLDAPDLQDDFYLNLVDWSSQNILSVGLGHCVYLWNAANSQVLRLCDLQEAQDTVTSVQWNEKGTHLAVGTNKGQVQIWDATTQRLIHTYEPHTGRIGCLAWKDDVICSGSRDRTIAVRDINQAEEPVKRMTSHRQEVCGLKWSPNKQYLASGGNDNQLLVWSLNRNDPVQTYNEHNAAVKALAWSPHHHGVLVSGGGTADRCLRFWNTLTGQLISYIDTSSQVCNVAWSKHSSELVSTHGYSHNQVILWKYPSMESFARLNGHTHRVLYLAMSPCGESIVTGAGDETLRFWHVFSNMGQQKAPRSPLDLYTAIR